MLSSFKKTINSKYLLFAIPILLAVIRVLAGFPDFIFIIITLDFAIVATMALQEKIPKLTKRYDNQFKGVESPHDWATYCTIFFFFSLFTGITYEVMIGAGIQVDVPLIGNWAMSFYSVVSFVFASIYLFRIAYFRRNPQSRINVLAGEIIHTFLEVAIRVTYVFLIVSLQFFNIMIFYLIVTNAVTKQTFPAPLSILYATTVVLSFAGMVYLVYKFVFRLKKPFNRRSWMFVTSYMSPWIVFFVVCILVIIGIKF